MDDSAHGKPAGLKFVEGTKQSAWLGDDEARPLPKEAFEPEINDSTFRVGQGRWWHAGGHLATTIATPAAYAPLPFAVSRLGWPAGMIALIVGTMVTMYTSCLIASLHRHNGRRYTRYRDLAYSIVGAKGYYAVILFQQIASIGNNISIQIVAGISMKSLYVTYNPDGDAFTLQEAIIVFGIVELILSQLPDIHSLRFLNIFCTFCTIAFAVICFSVSIANAVQQPAQERSQDVSYSVGGTPAYKIFGIFYALGTIAFSFGDTILPEIQATCREPAKKEMYGGVIMGYSVISLSYLAVTIAGYAAYGYAVAPFLVNSFTGATAPITMANIFAILQVVGCYQIYSRPTFEYVYMRVLDNRAPIWSLKNVCGRLWVTTAYVVLITFICCLIPFFGDFVALVGAVGFTPMDFVLPIWLYLACRKPKGIWRWFNILIASFYSLIAVLGAAGAIRFIIDDASTYAVFNNLPITG
ncbi:hypothetical protein WJX74_006848 [Apatococcus lobatus]|uniref:Amino acid transporter transmembrane domain-containing protein n=2 Tax=Apatococcus TaxID=904362 RepID=A0AAW1T3K9_9CHLO